MAENKGKSKLGLAGLLLATTLNSGCYMMNGPYAEATIVYPGNVSQRRVEFITRQPQRILYKDCHTYAASAEESMKPIGERRTRTVCSCYEPESPRARFTCKYEEN
jgi:hypothetical protein